MQAALTEINGLELAKQNDKPFAEVAGEYLQSWQDLGFGVHACGKTPLCLDAPVVTPDAVIGGGTDSLVNVMLQRPGGATLPPARPPAQPLAPRADEHCTGANTDTHAGPCIAQGRDGCVAGSRISCSGCCKGSPRCAVLGNAVLVPNLETAAQCARVAGGCWCGRRPTPSPVPVVPVLLGSNIQL